VEVLDSVEIDCEAVHISFASPRVAGKDIGRGFYSPREIIPAWPTARSKSAFIATIRRWMFIGREGDHDRAVGQPSVRSS
jgi:hypothetical protein